MTVGQLIELLDQYDENLEVRLMTQPSWPFEQAIAGVVSTDEVAEHRGEEAGDEPAVVYVCEGQQLKYGDKAVWEVLS